MIKTNDSNISLVSGSIPLCMLSVKNFRAPLAISLVIRSLNFNELLAVVILSLSDLNRLLNSHTFI